MGYYQVYSYLKRSSLVQKLNGPFALNEIDIDGEYGDHHIKPVLNDKLTKLIINEPISYILNDLILKKRAQEPFFIADVGDIVRQLKQWKLLLPRVEPFYAIKCNPDPVIIEILAKFGIGFDCASKVEIQEALKYIDASRIIYANPCKAASHIKYASNSKIQMMTFDNVDELYKIKSIAPNSKLVLRILADDSKSKCRFGVKFGASIEMVPILLNVAKNLELNVIGVR